MYVQLMVAGVLASLLSSVFNAVLAEDISIGARIDAVKVYQEGATITRRAQVDIPAGTHRLIFKELPANIDTETLKISVASREIRLGGIEVERVTDKDYANTQERELSKQLQTLTDQRTAVEDEIATAETQLKLIDSLASTPAGGGTKSAVDATNLSAVLQTMSTSAAGAREKVRNAKVRQRELNKNIDKITADLKKIATARKETYEVRASVDAANAMESIVAIEYSTGDAAWHWVYEARLDTTTKRVSIARQASVQQDSGEPWQSAALTLTTMRPSDDAMTPQVASLFLDLEDEARKRAPGVAGASMESIIVTAAMRPEVAYTDYLAEYKIPGRVTLDPDDEPRLYPVAEDAFSVDLTARVIPTASRSAYLEALFTYQGDVPMQGGQVQLYRDGALVGLARMGSLLPGAEARIPFGVDERVRVVVRDEPKQSGDEGLVSKHRIQEHKQRYEVTNYHSIPITVEIIDRLPVTENKDVRIDVLKGATATTENDLNGKSGVMLWRQTTGPQQTFTVRHYYSVRYPADRELREREVEE